jgi:glycosyltransferase involved in cell wall biosynthesis
MKILFVIPSYNNGGTISSLKNIIKGFYHDKRYEFDVFAISQDGPNRKDLCEFANVIGGSNNPTNSRKQSIYKIARSIKRAITKMGIDISPIILHEVARQLEKKTYDIAIAFQEGYPTYLVSYMKDTYKIAWIHCDYKSYLKMGNIRPEEECYKKFNKVVCVSKYTLNQFNDCISHPNSTYVHNIILDDYIMERAKESIEPNCFQEGKFNIISVGRLHPVKRFSMIPQVISKLKTHGLKDFAWYLIGGGSDEELGRIIEQKKIFNAEELILLGEKNNPYPYMAKADLFVCTSESEACPYVINEAKILHIPIVSTNFGSISEFLGDRQTGLISSVDNLDNAIAEIIENKDFYKSIYKNLENFRYDNEIILKTMENKVFTID